jgi:hypothetical protein
MSGFFSILLKFLTASNNSGVHHSRGYRRNDMQNEAVLKLKELAALTQGWQKNRLLHGSGRGASKI